MREIKALMSLLETAACVATGGERGQWRVDSRGWVYATDAHVLPGANKGAEDPYYGGVLIGESMAPGDRLYLSLAQPRNVLRLVHALRDAQQEIERRDEVAKDHQAAFEATKASLADALERCAQLAGEKP